MIAIEAIITGKVQGVYFREWAVRAAQELDVSGWIRNLSDGSVEVYAVADTAAIDRFVSRLNDGSPASEVERIIVKEAAVQKLNSFTRRQSA